MIRKANAIPAWLIHKENQGGEIVMAVKMRLEEWVRRKSLFFYQLSLQIPAPERHALHRRVTQSEHEPSTIKFDEEAAEKWLDGRSSRLRLLLNS